MLPNHEPGVDIESMAVFTPAASIPALASSWSRFRRADRELVPMRGQNFRWNQVMVHVDSAACCRPTAATLGKRARAERCHACEKLSS
jgi:hypothetical protein